LKSVTCASPAVPARVALPSGPGAQESRWLQAVRDLLDAAVAGDPENIAVRVHRVLDLELKEQLQVAHVLADRAKAIAAPCGGIGQLEDVTYLISRMRPPDLPGDTDLVLRTVGLLVALIAAGHEDAAGIAHAELLTYHPERHAALTVLLAGVAAGFGRIAYEVNRDPDGTPTSVRNLRESELIHGQDDPAVIAALLLVDGIHDQDQAAIKAAHEHIARSGPVDRVALGWKLLLATGARVGHLIASHETPK
jgi:hypothetical protein